MITVIKKNIKDSIKFLKDKRIFCFGCGIQGRRTAYYLKNWGLAENTVAYIDNSIEKIGRKIEYLGCEYDIISLARAVSYIAEKHISESVVFLVTTLYYLDVYEQINCEYPQFDFCCMSMDEIASEQFKISHYDGVIKQYSESVIPKVIHYAWFGGEKPDYVKRNIDNWHKMCPNFEIVEWNEKNYDVSKNRYMKQAFETAKWEFVSDYLRLDVIYNYGGIYLDTDICIQRNIDELLFQNAFGCCDATLTLNLGSGFGARPYHFFIKKLRDYYDNILFFREDGSIDNTSCNSHQLVVLSDLGYRNDDSLQIIEDMTIYPMCFQGANCHTKEYGVRDNTFWIHYGNMSWL